MHLGRRTALTVAIVIGTFLAVAIAEYVADGWEDAQALSAEPPQLYEGIPIDATLLEIDKRALEDAYHQQLLLLFSVWLKGDLAEDRRIKLGIRRARIAYMSAAQQIAKRSQELLQQDRQ